MAGDIRNTLTVNNFVVYLFTTTQTCNSFDTADGENCVSMQYRRYSSEIRKFAQFPYL